MSSDALDAVLRSLRLSGAAFLDAELTAPWALLAQVGPEDCRPYMPVPPRVVAYHYVVEGELVLGIDGCDPLKARAGQLIVLPRNPMHFLGSDAGVEPVDVGPLIRPGPNGVSLIRHGGNGRRTRIICGFLGSDARGGLLLDGLPPTVMLDLAGQPAGAWIEGSMRYAARELLAGRDGALACLTRLGEVLFAQAIREYWNNLPEERADGLRGLRDPFVARALAALHDQPDHSWSLEELARVAGLSRSAFSERFVRQVQVPPMRYLSRLRLCRAADRLRESNEPVSTIAFASGYESEASFTRAFKREFGTSPGAFRQAG